MGGASSVRVPLGVGRATAVIYFGRLGQVPLVDASDGFHGMPQPVDLDALKGALATLKRRFDLAASEAKDPKARVEKLHLVQRNLHAPLRTSPTPEAAA